MVNVDRQQKFHQEIVDLQEHLQNCNIDEEQQEQIIAKARALQNENDALQATINEMQAVDDESLEEVSDDEEYMRMRYFEAMRRA